MITKILIGLGIILGVIISLAIVYALCGLIYIFFNNVFSTTSYISYNLDNIFEYGKNGMLIIVFVVGILSLSYVIGLAFSI